MFRDKYCMMCQEQFNKYTKPKTMKLRLLVNDLSWRFICDNCTHDLINHMSWFYDNYKK